MPIQFLTITPEAAKRMWRAMSERLVRRQRFCSLDPAYGKDQKAVAWYFWDGKMLRLRENKD